MRRSVREALVGFSLLAAISGGLGLWMWLKGMSLSSKTWMIRVSFPDAAFLAERSPVYFRGVLVGTVQRIEVTDQAVIASLRISDPKLRLARPVVARVGIVSLLGGDAVVTLLSSGQPLPRTLPGPRESGCNNKKMVCDQGKVAGMKSPSLDTVTETLQNLLDEADQQKLLPEIVTATKTFEKAAKEAEQLTKESKFLVRDAQTLVNQLNPLVERANPILDNLNAASADAAQASKSVKNFTAALDDPKTVADLQATLTNAKQLTARWDAVGGDIRKLTSDEDFITGIRSVSAGLGRFFEDLYPAEVDSARVRGERKQVRKEEAKQRRGQAESRMSPRSR